MKDFSFSVPQEIIFGMGSLKKLPEILRKTGDDAAFIISDPGLKNVGLVDKVQKIVVDSGMRCACFTDIIPNPPISCCVKAYESYKAFGARYIIALGGGGPMDVAKAVGILAEFGGDLNSYAGVDKVPGPIVPLIAIPTTAGTGSEVTFSSVIVNDETRFKMAIVSHYLLPKYALLDPELIMTLPAGIAAACGVDAFIHAFEAYLSKQRNLYTDAMAEKAMELLGANIRRFVASRDNEEAACNMMLGSTFAGLAFARALLGNVHAMSHPVSGFFGVAHGVANAILLPVITEYNALADDGRYRRVYDYITEGAKADETFEPQMLAEAFRRLNRDLGIPERLRDVGVTEDKFPAMCADAMKSGNILLNPRQTNIKNVEELYRRAF